MMKSVGLITEYNPFHNGHLHHLQQSRRVTSAEVSIAVMSGHFLQRGEPALVDKWCRAAMALAAGTDLVFELPLPWACNSAPVFAEGGVAGLTAVGVDALCFGSESGNLDDLQACADLLDKESETIDVESRKRLRSGENYPTARAAIAEELSGSQIVAETLRQPNNILGIEYLRAIDRTGSPLKPFTIERIGAGYHQEEAVGTIASATGIRRMISIDEDVSTYLPPTTHELLNDRVQAGHIPSRDVLFRLLVQMLQLNRDWLRSLYQVEDGVENRLYKVSQDAETLEELVDAGKSKHLTRTRIQRLLIYILLGLDRKLMHEFLDCGPLYFHLLGQSPAGEHYLAEQRKDLDIPLVGNYSRIRSVLTHRYGQGTEKLRMAQEMLAWEIRATRTYTLLMKHWSGGNRNLDFFREVIRTSWPG